MTPETKIVPGLSAAGVSPTSRSRRMPPPTPLVTPTNTTPGSGMPACSDSCSPTMAKAGTPIPSITSTTRSTRAILVMRQRKSPTSIVAVMITGMYHGLLSTGGVCCRKMPSRIRLPPVEASNATTSTPAKSYRLCNATMAPLTAHKNTAR